MVSFIRRVKSALNASPKNDTRQSEAVESLYSIAWRQSQQQVNRPFGGIGRRLARKVSTFSLRRKRSRHALLASLWSDDSKSSHDKITQETKNTAPLSEEPGKSTSELSDPFITTFPKSEVSKGPYDTKKHNTTIQSEEPSKTTGANPKSELFSFTKGPYSTNVTYDTDEDMAADTSSPPIPLPRLKEIVTEACESALSPVISYTHADSEMWNTTIINTILERLVNESVPDASASIQNSVPTSSTMPQWKFVVNSTIIQHHSAKEVTEGRTIGRRGMHAASGAYWHNEKDGMWSFKYEAAETKGLDVVLCVFWIWVG